MCEIHQRLVDDRVLSQVLNWAAEFPRAFNTAIDKEAHRQRRRSKYFCVDVFGAGREARLRSEAKPDVDGLTESFVAWHEYAASDLEILRHYPDGIPDLLERRRRRLPDGQTQIVIGAWAPLHFTFDSPHDGLIPRLPTPPSNLGRAYSKAELSYGFLLLHDADGSLEPLVQGESPLATRLWRDCKSALQGKVCLGPGTTKELPSDTWVPAIRVLWARLSRELQSQTPPGGDCQAEVPEFDIRPDGATILFRGISYPVNLNAAEALKDVIAAGGVPVALSKYGKPTRILNKLPSELRPLVRPCHKKGYVYVPEATCPS